jgi:Leucine-rich repeat (LRR) protein
LEVLKIFGTRISEIPSNAFRPILGLQNKLSEIFLENNAIKTIGNYSFYDLTNLFWLDISENPLEYISMNAFNFRNDSNKVLRLDLSLFKIFNGSSFAIDS